jgi:hypothetical protein
MYSSADHCSIDSATTAMPACCQIDEAYLDVPCDDVVIRERAVPACVGDDPHAHGNGHGDREGTGGQVVSHSQRILTRWNNLAPSLPVV